MNTTFKQSHQLELTPQLVEAYMRRGHELRAEAIARGVRRWLATLKRPHKRATGSGDSPGATAHA